MSHTGYMARKRAAYFVRRVLGRLTPAGGAPASRLPAQPSRIPRILWLYWEQGFANAPAIVLECLKTWQARNAGWDIRLLDAESAARAVELPPLPATISSAHRADVLRTRLLNVHGGVWADATTWCLRPLDEWLPVASHTGFFIFNWDNSDRRIISATWPRLVGNWFIAAAPGNPLVAEWDRLTCAYWNARSSTTNYFWHNDALEYAVKTDSSARSVWHNMPKFSAGPPHFAWLALERGEDPAQALAALACDTVPLQKLSWRMKADPQTVLSFMAEVEASREACRC